MGKKSRKNNKKKLRKSPIFLIALFNFLIIILIAIYFIYLRFVPYKTITYDGYAVSGKDLVNNLLNPSFDVDQSIDALEVKDQDDIYQNLKSYYIGAAKEKNINLDYPIYVNDKLALYNLSKNMKLITSDLKTVDGYEGCTLTSGALYDEHTMERADYNDYIFMKNSDNMYINTKEIKIKTYSNKYTIKMNSVINFTKGFITYYTLEDGKFVYGKILDIDETSIIEIADFNCKYTYKKLMIAFGIMKEEVKIPEENTVEENKVEENKTEENNIKEEKPNIDKKPETQEKPNEEKNNNNEDKTKWQKPKVSCTNFIANIYSASTEVTIEDPSNAITKAVTFNFYKDDELSFRASSVDTELLKVTKLIPNTKYKVIGTYQYQNEEGNTFEVKFTTQEFKTSEADKVNAIELSFKNGKIYSDKIELQNLKIASDIEDEAINGVTKAKININGATYSITNKILKNILQGKEESYQTGSTLESNTKYKYEIIFYDTANNEMKLKGNKGDTTTLKQTPSVKIGIQKDMISNKLSLKLINKDDVQITNYKYELYENTGKLVKNEKIDVKKNELYFTDLDPSKTYEIKLICDYNIEDGNGIQKKQEIGNLVFTTEDLGNLVFDIKYQDLTHDEVKLSINVNSQKIDMKIMQILQNVKIQIERTNKDSSKEIVEEFNLTGDEISDFNTENGWEHKLEHLNSNTKYNIIMSAVAKQGSVIEDITTTTNAIEFETKKQPVQVILTEQIYTNNLIEFQAYVDDVDGACQDGEVKLSLIKKGSSEEYNQTIDEKTINVNEQILCTYKDLTKEQEYKVEAYIEKYNETNDEGLTDRKIIEVKEFETKGLDGELKFLGLTRKNTNEQGNLIDVESENNWYSECFGILSKKYATDPTNTEKKIFSTSTTRDYGKEYIANDKTSTLMLTANQCYVYNLKDYKDKEVTMSFKVKRKVNADIYIQKGKEIKANENRISLDNINKDEKIYYYTTKIPSDGYLGFFIDGTGYAEIADLQVEQGNKKTEYKPYEYIVEAKANAYFEDTNGQTKDDAGKIHYWINIKKDGMILNGEDNDQDGEKDGEDNYSFDSQIKNKQILYNVDGNAKYKIEIVIKKYGRTHILDEIDFQYDKDKCKEIKLINNRTEFLEIQPNGNYVVSKDYKKIKLMDATTESQYTFGGPNISFNGSIDFNGKTIEKDMKDSDINNNKKYTPYLFYKIGVSAKIKNLVYDYYILNQDIRADNNLAEEDGIYGLFLYNDGKIDNLMFNLKECTKIDKKYVALVGYENQGTIEKFVINLDTTLYGSQCIVGFCYNSYGTVQNGYLYGTGGIQAIANIADNSDRSIYGLIKGLFDGGIVQNVYNLTQITINHQKNTNSTAANIIGFMKDTAKVSHIYSTKSIIVKDGATIHYKCLDANEKEIGKGPNIIWGEYATEDNVKFSYYFCETTYDNINGNEKQDYSSLKDQNYQSMLLNPEGEDGQFRTMKDYFPHLKLSKCMPSQTYIKIQDQESTLSYISSKNIQYQDLNDDIKEKAKNEIEQMSDIDGNKYIVSDDFEFAKNNIQFAEISVYNPYGKGFSEDCVKLKYVDAKQIGYEKGTEVTKIYLLLTNPTSYINEYEIETISAINQLGDITTVKYGQDTEFGKKVVKASFTKTIKSEEDWHNINGEDSNKISGLIQNYKLAVDLNFDGKCSSSTESPYIGGFAGTLDGQNHTLSNIKGSNNLFSNVKAGGKLQNLKIEDYEQIDGRYCGIIGTVGSADSNKETIIDNIHINKISISQDAVFIGGLCGYLYPYNTTIQNCSVTNLTVKKIYGYNSCYIGGIVGYVKDDGGNKKYNNFTFKITNCYTKNINIEDHRSYNTLCYIGGILGCYYCESSSNAKKTVQNCYSEGQIIGTRSGIGGIIGSSSISVEVYNCYSLVNIKSEKDDIGGHNIGGIIGANYKNIENSIYLGNIETKYNSSSIRRIVGNTDTKTKNNYGYINQNIGTNISKELYGAKELLDYEEILKKDTWINKIKAGDAYNYEDLENGKLPRLLDTNGKILNEDKQEAPEFKLLDIVTSLESFKKINDNQAEIKLNIKKPDNVEITGVKFENNEMSIIEDEDIDITKKDDGSYILTFKAKPEKYYDRYKITQIKYNNNGNEKLLDVNIVLSDKPFYKYINSIEDWNNKDKVTNYGENYKLENNLEFDNDNESMKLTNYDVTIGRLESDNGYRTISGIELQLNNGENGFIKKLKTRMSNIKFESCSIEGGNTVGVIGENYGIINNCNFEYIYISGKQYVGIIGKGIDSQLIKINLSEIETQGTEYVGGLCGYMNNARYLILSDITAEKVNISNSGKCSGAIFGYTYGLSYKTIHVIDSTIYGKDITGGVTGYQSGSTSANDISVKKSTIHGTNNKLGGCMGVKNGGQVNNITSENNKIIVDSKSESKEQSTIGVGGCIGYGYNNGTWINIKSFNNEFNGISSDCVGGIIGRLRILKGQSISNLTSNSNTINNGKDYVGGAIGDAVNYNYTGYESRPITVMKNIDSIDNNISGQKYVGGVVGHTDLRMQDVHTKYSEENSGKTIHSITGSYIGGIVGKSEYSDVSKTTIDRASVENAHISTPGCSSVGGISGSQKGTINNSYVIDSKIYADIMFQIAGNGIGGLVGYYEGSDLNTAEAVSSESFYVKNSFFAYSTIEAEKGKNVGGLIGKIRYGTVRNCLVGNINIQAGTNVGGLIGYIANEDMTNKQYIVNIKNNYIANTYEEIRLKVKATDTLGVVGGIVGAVQLSYASLAGIDDYNLIDQYIINNLLVTDVEGNNDKAKMTIGYQEGRRKYKGKYKNTYVYKYSKVNGKQTEELEEKEDYELVTSKELGDFSDTSIYKDKNKLDFGDGYTYFNKYFPVLKDFDISVQPWVLIPKDPSTSTTNIDEPSLLSLKSVNNNLITLPELYTYAVDVDKINIEFSDINSNMKFDIKTNDGKVVLESTNVNKKVYTLNYDFSTPLIVTVSNGARWFTKEINKKDVQNLIQIVNDEYFYISDNKLYSNKRELEGEFLNIYNGKGLTSDGKIYNISDMSLVNNLNKEIKILDKEIPISETEYEGTNIKTFYHCSKISENNEEVYKDKQIFIKNGMMYLADGSLDSKGNAIIIDSYNENQYETILGTDGVIYDLLTKVKYPTNFKNKDIIAMNNNINNNNEIILVYYSNGRVYAFNYITGEEVFDNNIGKGDVSLVNYIMDNLDVTKTLYKTDKSSYAEAKKLTNKLEAMPIEKAITEITEGKSKNTKTIKKKDKSDNKYVTTYNSDTQTYVVYSTAEVLGKESSQIISENDKISKNTDLVEYYENISIGTVKVNGIGIIVFVITLTSICVILVIMNGKSKKLNK